MAASSTETDDWMRGMASRVEGRDGKCRISDIVGLPESLRDDPIVHLAIGNRESGIGNRVTPLDRVGAAYQFVSQTSLSCDMTPRETASLDRINAVTANFFFWQGLRWVPLGVALLVVAWSHG